MRLPLNKIREVIGAGYDAQRERDGCIRLSIMVSLETSPVLMRALRDALRPMRPGGRVHVEGFAPGHLPTVNALSDVAVIACGETDHETVARLWRGFSNAHIPCVICGLFDDVQAAIDCENDLMGEGVAENALLLGLDAPTVTGALGEWMIGSLDDELSVVAGANFPCCRRAKAIDIVRDTTRQNGAASLLSFLPGSSPDLMVMTTAQIIMALRLASLYDLPLDKSRLAEIIPIIGGAFGMRGLARLVSSRLPFLSLVVKGGIGAGGTYAMGNALVSLFEGMQNALESAGERQGSM